MKKAALIVFMLVCTASAYAATNYIYIARASDDTYVTKKLTELDEIPKFVVRKDRATQNPFNCYTVTVNKAQWEAGWDALDPAVKAAAKTAAQDEQKDIDKKMDKLIKAAFLVILDEYPIANFKQKVKAKYAALP